MSERIELIGTNKPSDSAARGRLPLKLAIVSERHPLHGLHYELANGLSWIQRDPERPEVVQLQSDGSVESRVNRGSREVDQESTARIRTLPLYSARETFAVSPDGKFYSLKSLAENQPTGLQNKRLFLGDCLSV